MRRIVAAVAAAAVILAGSAGVATSRPADWCARHPGRCTTPTPAPTTAPAASVTYTFDDLAGWQHTYACCGSVTMDRSLSYVSGGILHQRVERRSDGRWYADIIDTTASWTYGTVCARMRVTATTGGLWPAFWLYAGTFGTDGDEIDVVELLGSEGMVAAHQTVHVGSQSNQTYAPWSAITGWGAATDWHTYCTDWRADHVAFTIDGRETWRETTHLIAKPLRVLLNMGIGGWGGTPDPAVSGAELLTDYVTVTR